ncbi:MAG: hypothetical protein VXV96_16555 [Bdellovibrionota bacterium]|nr:hypothetical protein [Bdellovibrionota bacterium]
MKTTNWKALSRKLGVLSLTALLIASCGSDSNESKDSSSSSNTLNLGPVFDNTGATNDASVWSSLKSQVSCSQGRMSDMAFNYQQNGNYYGNTLAAQAAYVQSGGVSGTSQGSYYGRSNNGDLMYVSKVNNGSSITYNIVVSLCNFNDGIYTYIGDNAGMSNFAIQGIVLNNGSNCGTGAVTLGYFGFTTQAYGNQMIPIAFASAGVNCY